MILALPVVFLARSTTSAALDMEMDTEAIDALEQTYWTPNGETFDFLRVTVSPRWKCCRKSLQPVRVIFC
jgi:hypothetical protein